MKSKWIKPGGTLRPPSDVYVRSFLCPFSYFNKTLLNTHTHTHTHTHTQALSLNLRPDTIKLIEKNIGRTLFDINLSKIFLDPSPSVMKIKTNGTYLNLKAFAQQIKP